MIASPITGGNLTSCGNNLNQLCKAMYNYSIIGMELEGAFPSEPLGGRWWLILYEQREVEDVKLFSCPVSGVTMNLGETTYRGPGSDPNVLNADGPLGCCRPSNHGEEPDTRVTWVAKSGDVHKIPANSVQWSKILAQTKD